MQEVRQSFTEVKLEIRQFYSVKVLKVKVLIVHYFHYYWDSSETNSKPHAQTHMIRQRIFHLQFYLYKQTTSVQSEICSLVSVSVPLCTLCVNKKSARRRRALIGCVNWACTAYRGLYQWYSALRWRCLLNYSAQEAVTPPPFIILFLLACVCVCGCVNVTHTHTDGKLKSVSWQTCLERRIMSNNE